MFNIVNKNYLSNLSKKLFFGQIDEQLFNSLLGFINSDTLQKDISEFKIIDLKEVLVFSSFNNLVFENKKEFIDDQIENKFILDSLTNYYVLPNIKLSKKT